jgi:hypothetical protein
MSIWCSRSRMVLKVRRGMLRQYRQSIGVRVVEAEAPLVGSGILLEVDGKLRMAMMGIVVMRRLSGMDFAGLSVLFTELIESLLIDKRIRK